MDQESFGGLLESLDSLRLPSCNFGSRQCNVQTYFAYLVLFVNSCCIRLNRPSLTSRENGSFAIKRSVDFWYCLISLKATVPGLYLFLLRGLPALAAPLLRLGPFPPLEPFPPPVGVLTDFPPVLARPPRADPAVVLGILV